jgi:hypothetical protein
MQVKLLERLRQQVLAEMSEDVQLLSTTQREAAVDDVINSLTNVELLTKLDYME